ncbi:MAG: hypothetical protein HWE27_00505 [Gammaproteobacteria bacterium]|nr:hypothetical protein [Gammaproteobacteria bacterium]
MKHYLIILFLLSSNLYAADFNNSDTMLISHIKSTDYIFTSALGACTEEQLKRKRVEDSNVFEYLATCKAKAAKVSDCPEYAVVAKGTVDSPSWATVRSWSLELKCYG